LYNSIKLSKASKWKVSVQESIMLEIQSKYLESWLVLFSITIIIF